MDVGHGHVTPRPDGMKARCGGPALCQKCAQEAATAGFYQGGEQRVPCPTCGTSVPPGQVAQRVTESTSAEALIGGKRSAGDIRELLRAALRARVQAMSGADYCWVYVVDHTDTDVVYCAGDDSLWQCSYTITGDQVGLGEPTAVVPAYVPAPAAETAAVGAERHRHEGRVLEALDPEPATGARRYRVQIIAYGESKNGRRYPSKVMRAAASLYEGAKAYDHHRTEAELATGTIQGLVGSYSEVKATAAGIEATLTLLPSATHAAEALDAALAGGSSEPLVGISHDVLATFKPIVDQGRSLIEATGITRVLSADIVSDPAAGGAAIRAVAGGIDSTTDLAGTVPAAETEKEPDVAITKADLLAALKDVSGEDLAAVGLAKAGTATEVVEPDKPADPLARTEEAVPQTFTKGSAFASIAVKALAEAAELEPRAVEALLGDKFTEADITAAIGSAKALLAAVERPGLVPTATAEVTREAHDKKIAGLDSLFSQDGKGYRSFREAFSDITGRRPRTWDEDFNRTVLRESLGRGEYDSAVRSPESGTTATWDVILGDSITRRMVAEYSRPSLQTWRLIVSSIVPINDFRTQRIDRLGGYGVLPTVAQGAPYQPLTTPGDEEATYALSKRGGTEDLTLEMIANDDLRAIGRLPVKLGLAAAQTLYRFVWDILPANAATTYDSVALFHASHSNTTATAPLSQTNLSALRRKMRQQTAYGDTSDVLSIVPKYLVVPSALEEIAFQLSTSAVAIPATPAGASNTPNLHQGIEPIVIDYYSDADDWYVVCDPTMCPTIEVGFYQGRQDPELFVQADQTVGSMFNADKATYKIRHIYGEAVEEHRGFQRATN